MDEKCFKRKFNLIKRQPKISNIRLLYLFCQVASVEPVLSWKKAIHKSLLVQTLILLDSFLLLDNVPSIFYTCTTDLAVWMKFGELKHHNYSE